MFKPDFTAVVLEDCTYLEVTVANYINAYKASLIQRERSPHSCPFTDHRNHLGSQQSLNSGAGSPVAHRKATIASQSAREPLQTALVCWEKERGFRE